MRSKVPKFLLALICVLMPANELFNRRSNVVTLGLLCYQCSSSELFEFCNLTATTQSCAKEETCIAQYVNKENLTRSFKGCLNATECEELERSNEPGCQQGIVENRCSWCCSTDECNHDGLLQPREPLTSNETQAANDSYPHSKEATDKCLKLFRDDVHLFIQGTETFSSFCKNIPEVFRCVVDATQPNTTSGSNEDFFLLMAKKLALICPVSCNRSAAVTCVLDVFHDVISAFTLKSNSVCQELLTKMKTGYQCISHTLSSCDDGGAAVVAYNLVLRDLETATTTTCLRLPSIDDPIDHQAQEQMERVGLAPCQLEQAMRCIAQAGNEIIRNRIEVNGSKAIYRDDDVIESNMSCARTKSDSCVLVRRKRALLITTVVDQLRIKRKESLPPATKCNTTAARACLIINQSRSTSSYTQQACKIVEETKACVKSHTEECERVEKESFERALNHVLSDKIEQCNRPPFKCLSDQSIILTEGGRPQTVQVQALTSPEVICNIPGCKVLLDIILDNSRPPNCRNKAPIAQFVVSSDGRGDGLTGELCSRLITTENWNEIQNFHLAAKIDFKYDNTQAKTFRIVVRTMVNGTVHEKRTICEHQVLIIDGDRRSVCQSFGDPHLTTFDGRAYNNFLEGFFTLYRHRIFPYEVQAAFQRCVGGGATCNCAVAVRAGDSVFVLDKCRRRRTRTTASGSSGACAAAGRWSNDVRCLDLTTIEMFYHDKITHGFHVYSRGDSAFEILLPHGTRVVIRGKKWYNIYIYPSPYDWLNTDGLCGTYDGQIKNDLTLRNGKVWRETLLHRSEAPLDFSIDWK